MAWACVKDPLSTGGTIKIDHLTHEGLENVLDVEAEVLVKSEREMNTSSGWLNMEIDRDLRKRNIKGYIEMDRIR
ncbi:hypothetical protein MKW98_012933 [Papaver atlanticum]|uniref:Uncharacterized protein n=1 Tax=Papaver atlanticum TaxID=357466 RepID=A0AAD4TED0_9MAGN|nr:hypothetical protein MKW98_025905 [Papaver atlanticum]KAI3956539.1 hypothetical protein MKW98_012933 [Papaver atlanticum]